MRMEKVFKPYFFLLKKNKKLNCLAVNETCLVCMQNFLLLRGPEGNMLFYYKEFLNVFP